MKGLEVNDLLNALMGAGVRITDDIYDAVKKIMWVADDLSGDVDETDRRLTASITFNYAPYDDEEDAPQPAPVETPRKFGVGDKARVLTKDRSNYNEIIAVEGYTPEGYVYSHGGLCSYDEDELEPQPHDAVMVVRKAD